MNLSSLGCALDAVFRWTWQTSLAAVVLIALVLAAQALFGRLLPARWRYALGLLILLRLALPVAPSSSLSIFNLASHFTVPRDLTEVTTPIEPRQSEVGVQPLGDSAPASELSVPVVVPTLPIADSGVAPASRGSFLASRQNAPASPTKPAFGAPSIYSLAKYSWLLGSLVFLILVVRRHHRFSVQLV